MRVEELRRLQAARAAELQATLAYRMEDEGGPDAALCMLLMDGRDSTFATKYVTLLSFWFSESTEMKLITHPSPHPLTISDACAGLLRDGAEFLDDVPREKAAATFLLAGCVIHTHPS